MSDKASSSILFAGKRFTVCSREIQGKTGPATRDAVLHPGAVVILPIMDEKHILLIKNQRFAVDKELWELPAGTLERGETPLQTAKRELIEETGYEATSMQFFMNFYTTPGFCNEMMHAFIGKNLTYVGQALEDTERITVYKTAWTDAIEMVRTGEIADGKTIAALLYFHCYLSS